MNSDKVDFEKLIDPTPGQGVEVSEVSDVSEACNNYLDCESRILETEHKLKECLNTCLSSTQNECMYIVCTLVSVNRL